MSAAGTRIVPCLLATAASLLDVATSRADAPTFSWQAPRECPEEATVRAQLEGRLGSEPHSETNVVARVDRAPSGGYRLSLSIDAHDLHSDRVLQDASCDALAAATVVIAAFAMDVVAPPAAAGRAPAPRAPSAARAARHPAAAVPSTPGRDNPGLALELRVGGDVGTGPAASGGLGVAAQLQVGPYRIEAAGTTWGARRAGGAAGAKIDLVQGSLRACRVLPLLASPEVSACGGLDAGVLRAEAFGVREPLSPSVEWLAGTLGLWLRAGWGPVSVTFGIEGLVPLSRPRFFLHEQGLIYRPSAVAGRLWAGAGWRFR